MAAPNNVFLDKCIINKVGSTEYKVLLAKPLAAYVSGITDATAQMNKFKELFKVDHAVLVKDSSGNVGIQAFVENGGANAYFHNLLKRMAHSMLQNNGKTYIGLNDGGLNILGEGRVVDIKNVGEPTGSDTRVSVGEITLHFEVKAPWYSPVKVIIYKETANGEAPIMQERNYPAKFNGIDTVNVWAYDVGLVKYRAKVTNEEGTAEQGGWTSQTIKSKLLNATYSADSANAALSGEAKTVYIKTHSIDYTPDSSSTQLWEDEACSDLAPNGYYIIGDYWYQQGWSTMANRTQIIASGKAVYLPSHPDYVAPDSLDNITIGLASADVELVDSISMWWTIGEIWINVYNENDSAKTVEVRGLIINTRSGNIQLNGGTVSVPANSSAQVRVTSGLESRVQTESNEIFGRFIYNVQGMVTTNQREFDLINQVKEEK